MQKILYDHWKILLAFLLSVGGISLAYRFWQYLQDFFLWQYSGWLVLAVALIGAIIWSFLYKLRSKKSYAGIYSVSGRPNSVIYTAEPTEFNVNWHLYMGTSSLIEHRAPQDIPPHDFYGYIEGPYCPQCDYELDIDHKRRFWRCGAGHGRFKIPKHLRLDTRDKITKLFEANFRTTLKKATQ